jgi:hypothetical protein
MYEGGECRRRDDDERRKVQATANDKFFELMSPFLRVFFVATAACVIVGILPLHFIGALLCWAIVVGSAWRYVLATGSQVRAMLDPLGHSIAMGTLMGSSVNLASVIVRIIYNLAVLHVGPRHYSYTDVGVLAALGATFVWGTLLGASGGLIGGFQLPKSSVGEPAKSGGNMRFIWIAMATVVLLCAAIILYVISLANAMSDLPG